MADDLIDQYLNDLRRRLGVGPTVDGRVAEAADHLRTTADALVRSGMAASDAQRESLRRFGTSRSVARQLRASGLGVPSTFTRLAGGIGLLASALSIAVAATVAGLLTLADFQTVITAQIAQAVFFLGLVCRMVTVGRRTAWVWLIVVPTVLAGDLSRLLIDSLAGKLAPEGAIDATLRTVASFELIMTFAPAVGLILLLQSWRATGYGPRWARQTLVATYLIPISTELIQLINPEGFVTQEHGWVAAQISAVLLAIGTAAIAQHMLREHTSRGLVTG